MKEEPYYKKNKSISSHKWGEVKVEGEVFKDVKCFPGGCKEWDWKETETRHVPGIQVTDVQELIDNGSKKIILSKGRRERLRTAIETINFLEEKGIPYHILETSQAIELYNSLVEKEPVGGLFHSTC
ncbi:MTH938/NDUFAF3 family protein [Rapidithrix thailandica]|uniref:MTH938/NDUFAF3 family protein n=1 Tax=Rapidithrix thailandica TaxID=413964 RepID=A0AAW9SDU3_9BACT